MKDDRIEAWQKACSDGTCSAETIAEIVTFLRAGRERASTVAAIKKTRAKKGKSAALDLLEEFRKEVSSNDEQG